MQATGLTKEQFLKTNAGELDTLAREEGLSLAIVWPIMYAELGLSHGLVDPTFIHSEGEYGALPLPKNLKYWTGDSNSPNPEARLSLEENIHWFFRYLKGLTTTSPYDDWFTGISDPFTFMRRLAAVVHGWGYSGVYTGSFNVQRARKAAELSGDEADRILSEMGYKNAGKGIVPNRIRNLDLAFNMVGDLDGENASVPAGELSSKTRKTSPTNKNLGAGNDKKEIPDTKTVKKIQQLIGLAWTDWDEPEMQVPTLEYLNGIPADTPAQKQSKAEAQQLIANSWGKGEKLDELSHLLAAWAEGNIHATDFDAEAEVKGESSSPSAPAIITSGLPRANGEQIAICVGHTLTGEGSGYLNKFVSTKNERVWNEEVAKMMQSILIQQGASPEIYFRDIGSYSRFIADSAAQIRQRQPQCKAAIELHYNAFTDPKSKGCEFIYFSNNGGRLARELATAYKSRFPKMTMRRDKGTLKLSKGRGVGWLKKVAPPAVIAEPFFASNRKEMTFFDEHKAELAEAYAEGVLKYVLG